MVNDPWSQGPPNKSSRGANGHVHTHQPTVDISKLTNEVEQRLKAKMTKPEGSEDELMADVSTVNDLEARLSRLEVQVKTNHEEQQTQNQEIASQIAGVHHRVESQSQEFTKHMDAKLAEQLSHIERLLGGKKPRTE